MNVKTFLVIFLVYLIMAQEAEAFLSTIGNWIGGALSKLFGRKRKREIETFFDPNQQDLDRELERLLSQFN
uniref:Antimicrobial non-disulfide-bridged peptide n=1 Tax=Didymocentrus krausi TaxID=1546215 RepID=A0A3S8V4U2_9SCOR|nr:antimicrobial non-disulfide-bridged peptide [Didymocentrus krausi]